MGRKAGFGVKLFGVTGRDSQVPIASWGSGGSVGRRDSNDLLGSRGCLCTYCFFVSWQWALPRGGHVQSAGSLVVLRHFLNLGVGVLVLCVRTVCCALSAQKYSQTSDIQLDTWRLPRYRV